MPLSQDLNKIIASLGMIVILAVAVVSDQLIYFFLLQARFSIRQADFNMLSVWVRTFGILITSVGFIILACFIYSRVSKATLIGLVFLVVGVLLAFYPEINIYGRLNLGIVTYLARYHSQTSILYHSSGLTIAIGLLTLLNRRPLDARKNAGSNPH